MHFDVDPTFESPRIALYGRNRKHMGGATIAWLISLFGVLGASRSNPSFLVLLPLVVGLGALATFYFARFASLKPRFVGIRADREGLWHEGKLVVPRGRIKQGFVLRDGEAWMVHLEGKGLALAETLSVPSEEEGRALLRALGLDATQVAAEIRARSLAFARPVLVGAVGAVTGLGGALMRVVAARSPIGPLIFMVLLFALISTVLVPTKVRVGADGILTRWLGIERFYPYGSVDLIQAYESSFGFRRYIGLELVLKSGKKVRIPMGQTRYNERDNALLMQRVMEAVDAYRDGYSGAEASALARGDRSVTEWITALRSLGSGAAADLRHAAVPADRLLRLALDATAAPMARAAAAVALGPVLGESDKDQIRIAADTTASPKLRVALEHAITETSGEAEALEEALSELEAEKQDRREA